VKVNIDLEYTLAGAVTGFVVGLTGVGGGALMTPLLVLVFGDAPQTAIATDLWFAAITKLVAVPMHHRAGQVDWKAVRQFWFGSLPFALLTVLLVTWSGQVGKVEWLGRAVGAVVLVAAVGLVLGPSLHAWMRSRRIKASERFKSRQPTLAALAGAVLGTLVALTSVGAGALGSVMMLAIYPLRMTPQRLVATDLAHAIPLAIVAGSGYLVVGLVDLPMLASMLLGSIPAVLAGSALALRLHARWLRLALAAVLALVAVKSLIG
jgi:uncharacterized membrane protein YfcA